MAVDAFGVDVVAFGVVAAVAVAAGDVVAAVSVAAVVVVAFLQRPSFGAKFFGGKKVALLGSDSAWWSCNG